MTSDSHLRFERHDDVQVITVPGVFEDGWFEFAIKAKAYFFAAQYVQGVQEVARVKGYRAAAGNFGSRFGGVLAQLRGHRPDT